MPVADLILKNARVITLDPAVPEAEMVAVRGDKILLVADNGGIGAVSGPGTRIIDCQGMTVAPGFNDAHCHIFSFLRKLLSVDLSVGSVTSLGDIKAIIRRKAEDSPTDRWITCTGYDEFCLDEKRHPTRWDIDDAAPDHPVVIYHRSLHACVLNSQALALAGINNETEEPPDGHIDRDITSGEPNGLLIEMTGFINNTVISPLSEAELEAALAQANEHYLSQGITSLQDASVTNDYHRWEQFRRFKESGKLKSRLSMMPGIDNLAPFQEKGLVSGSGDINLRLGAVKLMLSKEETGHLYPPQTEINRLVLEAQRSGYQTAIHAVESETVEAAITALENAAREFPQAGRRHRIEHCSECPPPLLRRLKKLNAMVVTQPSFLYFNGERYIATVTEERFPWLYRIRSFLENGLVTVGSSDSPIVPDNPLVGIYAAVTRRAGSGRVILPEERISADRALRMYTADAAYASFEESIKGSVTEGKLADLVVLSDDPTSVSQEGIKDIRVEMTIIGGEVVWEG